MAARSRIWISARIAGTPSGVRLDNPELRFVTASADPFYFRFLFMQFLVYCKVNYRSDLNRMLESTWPPNSVITNCAPLSKAEVLRTRPKRTVITL